MGMSFESLRIKKLAINEMKILFRFLYFSYHKYCRRKIIMFRFSYVGTSRLYTTQSTFVLLGVTSWVC